MEQTERAVTVYYDREGDYLEVLFEQKPGYFRETDHDAVMKRVDTDGNVIGFSILKARVLTEQPLSLDLGEQQVSPRRRGNAASPHKGPVGQSRNTGKAWSAKDEKQLKTLAEKDTPARVVGFKLGRTEGAVRSKASELGISLKPTNQSPYNRRKK